MLRAGFRGRALTASGYELIDCQGYPGLVHVPHSDSVVHGELYAVDPDHLSELDAYEDLASGEYVRSPLIVTGEDGQIQAAQTYFYNWPWAHLPRIGDTWLPGHEMP